MLKSILHRGALGALLLAAGTLGVAEPSLAQVKVGVVNVRQLIEESPQYKTAMTALENEFKPRQREIENQQKAYKTREEKMQRESSVMSEADRTKAERELRDSQRELVRRQNEFVEDLNVRRNEELGRLQKTLLQEVQNYAKAQGYDLIIGEGVLYAKDAINITPAVLAGMKSNAPAAAAPKPAEKKP